MILKNKILYIVKYSVGSYDDYQEVIVFATKKKSTAINYVEKFNQVLHKWYAYYSQYEEDGWIKSEYVEKYFDRWRQLSDINRAFFEETTIR